MNTPFIQNTTDGHSSLHLMVENVHCAGCIGKIERALLSTHGVLAARINMSTRRLIIEWEKAETNAEGLMKIVSDLGYPVAPFDPGQLLDGGAAEDKRLLLALAVAGFAAGNVMLLSVSVWSGHFSGMGIATRDLFHWVSALIALPTVAYSGRIFFKSAFTALRGGSMNMDVPISLAVLLASGMSLQQTIVSGPHAYFDASVTLLFFLLIGRYLDRRARAKARSAAERLLGLQSSTATVVDKDGTTRIIAVSDLEVGSVLLVAAGERMAADGIIIEGSSDTDTALVTGESMPREATIGDAVFAGTVNLTGPLKIQINAAGEQTLLSEIVRLMEAAEQARAKYVRLADRIARLYAPAVHILAAGTFLGWYFLMAHGWQDSLMAAIAVLIITCPCALGLAVPVVQVVASGKLLSLGVLLKAPEGLERLEQINTIVFDKTGTLTLGQPSLTNLDGIPKEALEIASSLAVYSHHPLSRAITAVSGNSNPLIAEDVTETPGSGVCGTINGQSYKLGNRRWCAQTNELPATADDLSTEIWLVGDGIAPQQFRFTDALRPDSMEVISALQNQGHHVELLSGDREAVVEETAKILGIKYWQAECKPDQKVARLKELSKAGNKVLMVGDGLNDAPALAAGFASMSPATASDISQTAADFIFQGKSLKPVLQTLSVARLSGRLVRQNFALAFLYNAIAVPLAIAGLATPLVAAIAMSSSSLVVTLNALRLRWK